MVFSLSQISSHWEWTLGRGFSTLHPFLHWTCVHKPKRAEEANDGILGAQDSLIPREVHGPPTSA